jgi:hypothetical protein
MHEDGFVCMTVCSFQQVERSDGIHIEVIEWATGGQVMAGLRGCVDNQVWLNRFDEGKDGLPVADVQFVMFEVGVGGFQPMLIPAGITFFAKEIPPHVVIGPGDLPAAIMEVGHNLGADQAVGASDDQSFQCQNPLVRT